MAGDILQTQYAINGSFGRLYVSSFEAGTDVSNLDERYGSGQNQGFIAEVQRVEGMMRINRRDIMRAGTRQTGYKAMTVMGEGTIGNIKSTSRWQSFVAQAMQSGANDRSAIRQPIFNLRVEIDDPEAIQKEEFVLERVRIWEAPIGFNVTDILEENVPFTFEGYREIQHIYGNVGDPGARRNRA